MPPALVSQHFNAIIANLAEKSKENFTYSGRLETDKNFQHVWNRRKTRDKEIIYEINDEHPVFLRLIDKFPACEKNFRNLLKLIAAELPITGLTLDLRGDDAEIKKSRAVLRERGATTRVYW